MAFPGGIIRDSDEGFRLCSFSGTTKKLGLLGEDIESISEASGLAQGAKGDSEDHKLQLHLQPQ